MTSNDLTLIIKGTAFVFDTVDRLVHFAQGWNAGQFHASMDKMVAAGHFEEDTSDEQAMLQEAWDNSTPTHGGTLKGTDDDLHSI